MKKLRKQDQKNEMGTKTFYTIKSHQTPTPEMETAYDYKYHEGKRHSEHFLFN
jgi:hypothetical protein